MDRVRAMESDSPERKKLIDELSAYYSSDAWKHALLPIKLDCSQKTRNVAFSLRTVSIIYWKNNRNNKTQSAQNVGCVLFMLCYYLPIRTSYPE